MKSAGEKNG